MCGRYALHTALEVIARQFAVADYRVFAGRPGPGYNLAPTQLLPVCLVEDGARRLRELRWGLVPGWARDETIGARLINARAETVATRPAFRSAYRRRRCVVPADGFYEWQKTSSGKQPWYVQRADRMPMAMAGLWEQWRRPDGDLLLTFTIVTTEANDALADVHGRMPVLLDEAGIAAWLSPGADPATHLVPWPAEETLAYPVSRRVNDARHDSPDCVTPRDAAPADG